MTRVLFAGWIMCLSLLATRAADAGMGSEFQSGPSRFRRTEPGRWEEVYNGVPTYRFVETAAGPNTIVLYDSSRGIQVNLKQNSFEVSRGSTVLFSRAGNWIWQEWLSNNGRKRFGGEGNGDWTEFYDGRPGCPFREVSRSANHVALYDASRGITVKLTGTSCTVTSGADTIMTESGHWVR